VTSVEPTNPVGSVESSAHRVPAESAPDGLSQAERTYVLDTSVLLSDPRALFRFAEHAVVLPVVVITELEAKRNDPEIGFFARKSLRILDDLRVEHERLDFPIPVGDGGSLRVELNHSSLSVLPSGLQLADNDSRILACAMNLANDGLPVTVVSKDLPLRVKAASIGLDAQEYRAELAVDSGWTGMAELALGSNDMAKLYEHETLTTSEVADLPVNTGLVIHSERGSALARVVGEREVRLVRGDRDVFGVHGRSAEQRLAIDLLLDQEIGILSLGGRAGTGKSALALCAGLEAVLERVMRQLRDELSTALPEVGVSLAVGSIVEHVSGLRRSLAEAAQVARAAPGLPADKPYHELSDIHIRGLLHLLGVVLVRQAPDGDGLEAPDLLTTMNEE
jgi:PhoH-like ATPase